MVDFYPATVIREQLNKCIKYYIFDESEYDKLSASIYQFDDNANVIDYAKKYESETDALIHSLANRMIDKENDRENTLKIFKQANSNVAQTLIIRYIVINVFLEENSQKTFPVSASVPQFFIDCLINFWREYLHDGPINFLR